jgi:NADH-quinone oxidoreductase subunit N
MIPVPPISDLQAIIPQILVAALAMGVLLADAMAPKSNGRKLAVITVVGLLVAIGVSLVTRPENHEPVLAGMVIADGYAHFFNILFMVSALLSVLLSVDYLEREDGGGASWDGEGSPPSQRRGPVPRSHGEYYALVLLTTVGMMIMASATDLIAIFLGLEVLSISLYILAGYQRDKLISEEAALKYFLLGAFASAFFLYGIALIYGATGATNLHAIVQAFPRAGEGGEWTLLLAGTALLIVGFGFKVAVVPFHVWTPDVYEGAPTSITAFMSVGAKAAGFAAFLRVFVTALPAVQPQAASVLAVIAALTMIVGNVVAIVQSNIKRLLAYSSIAHAGYLMLGLTAASLGATRGVSSVLFYTFAYTVTNLGAFAVVLALRRRGEEVLELDDYAGLGFKYPVLGALMSLFMLSLAGIPPTVGFLGKLYLFTAAIETGRLTWLVVLGVLTSVVSVYYYLRVIVMMYMAPAEVKTEETQLARSGYLYAALGLTGLATLLFGILPAGVLQSAAAAFESVRQFTALR